MVWILENQGQAPAKARNSLAPPLVPAPATPPYRAPPLGLPGLQSARAGLELARPSPPPTLPREGNRQLWLLGPTGSVVVMEYPWDDLTLAFSRTSMFPFFDVAHYLVSVMALRQRPGAAAVAWSNPVSSWMSAMLHCFGGGILSCVLLAEPPVKFLTNHTNILLASSIW
ncbi:trimeric intracellular cation channel type B-like [Peromyscus leucopus]|uniref:trimeric intracellular cation channel type B-like n=1 Tax=Peromyscus leucopus TaxID=10041 RepID=UPI0010A1C2A1|nr:trimeric intracellular cation channel type B-like [Peromyscus leucopus]